ncbi:MAG: flagellar biosynthesis anti-sigma factor FlgM [Lawsonibacter sp.]|jgi:anti-sigma28 factor (negative regulator of flagellin synthesis)
MVFGIKPPGMGPVNGSNPTYNMTNSTARKGLQKTQQQNCDQFQCSLRPSGEERQVQEMTSQITQQIRLRPSKSELAQLQQQVQNGTYQPDAREIAARMLLIHQEE